MPQRNATPRSRQRILTERILALSALLAAVGALVLNFQAVVVNIWDFFARFRAPTTYPRCVDVSVRHQPIIPYSLLHNFGGSDTLYWLKVEAENRCDRPVSLSIVCDQVRADIGVSCADIPAFNLSAGEDREEQIDPRLQPLADILDPVLLDFRVRIADQDNSNAFFDDVLTVTVLPRTTYFWNLEDTSKETVLASLAVWTVRPRTPVDVLAEELAEDYRSIDGWMERAHERVFADLEVVADDRRVPPPASVDSIAITAPETVLQRQRAIPIETALLFGALAYKVIQERGARVILISTPGADAQAAPDIFVAWMSGPRLRAFETSGGGTVPFDRATSEAASRLQTLPQEILTALNGTESNGVYYLVDNRVVALDLGQTITRHNFIAGLP